MPTNSSRRIDPQPQATERSNAQEISTLPGSQPPLLVFCGIESYFDGDAVKLSTGDSLQLLNAALTAPNSSPVKNLKHVTLPAPKVAESENIQTVIGEKQNEIPRGQETAQKQAKSKDKPQALAAGNKTVSRSKTPATGAVPKPEDKNKPNPEKALFPMRYMQVTQGAGGSYSHQGTNALDLAGADSGCDTVYAPFTGVIRRIYTFSGNFVWLESSDKVTFADGTVDFMTIMVGHNDDVSTLYVGQVIPQGAAFYREGKAGIATGNHVHLECARGKFSGNGWRQNALGNWLINNSISPYKALFIQESTIVLNNGGYYWQISKD